MTRTISTPHTFGTKRYDIGGTLTPYFCTYGLASKCIPFITTGKIDVATLDALPVLGDLRVEC